MSDVTVAEVKDVDVNDIDTDSDSVESYEEQVPNSTKGSTAKVIHLKLYQLSSP